MKIFPYLLPCALSLLVGSVRPVGADVLTVETFGFAGGKVVRLDELTGAQLPGFAMDPTLVLGSNVGRLSGLAVSPAGVAYVSSLDTGHILQFDLATGAPVNGGILASLPMNLGEMGLVPASPTSLRVGPDGLLYVAEGGSGSVLRVDLTTGAVVDAPVSGIAGAGGIGFTSNGDLLSTDNTFVSLANIYRGLGQPPTVFVSTATSQISSPASILVHPDDSFFVADLFGNRLISYSADGQTVANFVDIQYPAGVDPFNPPPGSTVPSNFPSDVIRDAEGNILVINVGISSVVQGAPQNYGSLLRYDPTGQLIERLADNLFAPAAIAMAPGLIDLEGDYNRDGSVTTADYDLWNDGFGRFVTPGSNADGNADGLIDAADYTVWRDNLPEPLPGGANVPEPNGLLLLAIALSLIAAGRRGSVK